jgi:hypothetical protein
LREGIDRTRPSACYFDSSLRQLNSLFKRLEEEQDRDPRIPCWSPNPAILQSPNTGPERERRCWAGPPVPISSIGIRRDRLCHRQRSAAVNTTKTETALSNSAPISATIPKPLAAIDTLAGFPRICFSALSQPSTTTISVHLASSARPIAPTAARTYAFDSRAPISTASIRFPSILQRSL